MKHGQNHRAPLLSLQSFPVILFPFCNPKVTLIPQGLPLPWQGCVRSSQRAEGCDCLTLHNLTNLFGFL